MLTSLMKYSGLVAKTKAMYGKRLRYEDYEALKGMTSVAAIASYLKQHPGYKDAMFDITENNIHRGSLESHLREELSKEYTRLLNFVSGSEEEFLNFLVVKLEMDEILYYIRLIISQTQSRYTPHMLPTIAKHSHIPFDKLNLSYTFCEFAELMKETHYYSALTPFVGKEFIDYTGIELSLNAVYFRYLLTSLSKNISVGEQKKIGNFIGGQIDLINFLRIIRCKRYFHQPDDHIYANILPFNHRIDHNLITKMVTAPTWEEAYGLINETPYKSFFNEFSFDYVEEYYYEYLFESAKKIIYSSQTGICVPFAFLNIKQIEIKNLTNIIECVRYNVSSDQLERHLIGVKGGEK